MEGEDKEDLKALRRGWFLGGEEFLERLDGGCEGSTWGEEAGEL